MTEPNGDQQAVDGLVGPVAIGGPAARFEMIGVEAVRHAAAPTLRFSGHVTESEGREVFTIALSIQIMIEPAKRTYDDATRGRLLELFGPPERWAATTQTFLWAETSMLVPAFTGATAFQVPLACTYDHEVSSAKYLRALPDGEVPLQFNFTGTIFYRAPEGQMQIVQIPWDSGARFSMPISVWDEMMAEHYPNGSWIRLADDTLEALAARKADQGHHTLDATVAALLEES